MVRMVPMAKMVPMELNITIDKALQMNPELRGIYESDQAMHDLIDMAKKQILPAVMSYTKKLADTVIVLREAGADPFKITKYPRILIPQISRSALPTLQRRRKLTLRSALRVV